MTSLPKTALAVVPPPVAVVVADRTAAASEPALTSAVGEIMASIHQAVTSMQATDISLDVSHHTDVGTGRSVATMKFRAYRRADND